MKLPVSLTRGFGRQILILKKQSPHIFFVAGVVGSVASTVMACRATLKLSETLDDIQKDLVDVKDLRQNVSHAQQGTAIETYANAEYSKDIAYVYLKGGIKLTKLYGPSAIVGVASITLLTKSHVEMTKRNAALMAAYAAVQEAYFNYRERVREKLGDEGELEIYHAVKTEKVDKELIKSADPNKWSPYARFFDEYSDEWKKDPEYNRLYVQCQQNYANNLLKSRGHIFLNEVYDMLGLPRSSEGAIIGWIKTKDSDNFIDFGLYEAHNSSFMNGWERSILLDFNVDGVIYDKI